MEFRKLVFEERRNRKHQKRNLPEQPSTQVSFSSSRNRPQLLQGRNAWRRQFSEPRGEPTTNPTHIIMVCRSPSRWGVYLARYYFSLLWTSFLWNSLCSKTSASDKTAADHHGGGFFGSYFKGSLTSLTLCFCSTFFFFFFFLYSFSTSLYFSYSLSLTRWAF